MVEKLPFCEIEVVPTHEMLQKFYNYKRYEVTGKRYAHVSTAVIAARVSTLASAKHVIDELRVNHKISPGAPITYRADNDVVPLMSDADWIMLILRESA